MKLYFKKLRYDNDDAFIYQYTVRTNPNFFKICSAGAYSNSTKGITSATKVG